jgi:hypothetical protein
MVFKGNNLMSVEDLTFSHRWLRRIPYSRMWRRAVLEKFTDILEQLTVLVIGVEEKDKTRKTGIASC